MGGQGADQSGELRRLEKVRHSRIHRRAVRSGVVSDSRTFYAVSRALQEAWNRDADWHKSRFTQRSHFEPLRRHAARYGRERARVRADRARSRLSRVRLFDEVEQSESDDRRLSFACRAVKRRRSGLELSNSSWRNGSRRRRRRANQKRDWNRFTAL